MHVFHTPSSGQSELNKLHDTPRGSSSYSNQPNDDRRFLIACCVVNHDWLLCYAVKTCMYYDITVVLCSL
jgi:hypothetical protein